MTKTTLDRDSSTDSLRQYPATPRSCAESGDGREAAPGAGRRFPLRLCSTAQVGVFETTVTILPSAELDALSGDHDLALGVHHLTRPCALNSGRSQVGHLGDSAA
jgi:hypothetical protein